MKRLIFLLVPAIFFCNFYAVAQTEPERLNLPGDNLNLYAVLKLFQESPTLEGFEKKLNDSSSNINNLDLNGDNKTDYIRVVDNPDGDIHNIALKVAVNKDEDQDVAVFVVQKKADNKVQVQLIGDEDLYGKDYIIEPNMADAEATAGETPNPGYSEKTTLANGEVVTVQQTTTNQIAGWPLITYIYVPTYIAWQSPWYWDNYPFYWTPWQPFFWHYYYGYHFHWEYYYYGHYRHWSHYRIPGWRDHYYGSHYHSRSPYVQNRYRQGAYNHTYSRPQSANAGAERFKRDNPQAPSVHTKLPSFDHTGTPVTRPHVVKPVVNDEGTTAPTKVPGIKPPTRPVTNDEIKTVPTRPVKQEPIRPVKQEPVRPVKQEPVRPVKQEPVRPVKQEPVRPVKQEPASPPVRPVTPTRPSVTRPVETRPAAPDKNKEAG